MNSKKKCEKCKGTGFLKYEIKHCEKCNISSRERDITSGLEKKPWDLCDKCNGDGEITT